jgi:hypothetical protein
MIVVDETVSDPRILTNIAKWYPGQVISVKSFRPQGRVLDYEIPDYLLQLRQPTFVTINYDDFAPHLCLHQTYCVMRFKLPQGQALFLPYLLRAVLRDSRFNTKAKRMGKVISWTPTSLSFVEV